MSVLEVVFLILFWSWALSAVLFLRNTFLPRLPAVPMPPDLRLPVETVSFEATDGVLLEGWKTPGGSERPWIILCHGLGANRADLLDIAASLYEAGFNLLLFDFRGHGRSAGRCTSFGLEEQRDLEGALAFLGAQPEVPSKPFGVYGISMGASVSLMVAARDERIGAVAADSPYTSLEASLGRHLQVLYPLIPRVPFLGFVLLTYRLRFHTWPRYVAPQRNISRLSPRPVLIIQGALDQRAPLQGAWELFEAAGKPKELWVIEGAGHLEGTLIDQQRYSSRLISFFSTMLAVQFHDIVNG